MSQLAENAIESVSRVELTNAQERRRLSCPFSENPAPYMVRLTGESRFRRVYVTQYGNFAHLTLKIKGESVGCETALDAALRRQ